jgi:hypothetical protein
MQVLISKKNHFLLIKSFKDMDKECILEDNAAIVKLVVKAAYTGSIELKSEEDTLLFLRVASKLKFKFLKELDLPPKAILNGLVS